MIREDLYIGGVDGANGVRLLFVVLARTFFVFFNIGITGFGFTSVFNKI